MLKLRFIWIALGLFPVWTTVMQNSWAVKPSGSIESIPAGVEIDRIEITGVKAFKDGEIEGVLEVQPGDRLERVKVLKTEANLQTLYVRHGYEQMGIRSRLVRKRNEQRALETVLEFSIQEGRPVRVGSIQLIPVGLSQLQARPDNRPDSRMEKRRTAWQARESKLRAKLGLFVGDILDQDKLAEGKRKIQELLASNEYIGSKVDHSLSLALPPKSTAKAASQWVALELRVDLGDQVSFGFRGNSVFTRGYLDAVVDEQKVLGLGKDYIEAIRTKLEDEYHSAGYARVEIVPFTFESATQFERKVTYIIQEGPRVKLDSIDFDGNQVFSGEELRRLFFAKASTVVQHRIYAEKDIQKASELLIESLKEKGYLSARLVTTNTTYPPKPKTQVANSSVKVLIYLYEGEQTVVDSISVQGASVFTSPEIQKALQLQTGKPLNLFALSEGIESLKKSYRDRGYLGFRILNEGSNSLIQYLQENHLAKLQMQLDEGMQYKVSRIEIEGLTYTQEVVARRELIIKEGEILKEKDLVTSERRLRKLGIFSEIAIKSIDDPSVSGMKIVRITLKEADRGILAYGPGFRNDLGIRAFSQLSYANLWGANHTLSLSANANRRFNNYQFGEGQAQISYVWPWFLLPELNFRPTVAISRTQYINFSADSVTAAANWDKQLLASPNITAYLSYTIENINQFLAVDPTLDDGQFQIGTITPKVSIDLRDSPLAPTRGFFGVVWLDLALPAFGSGSGSTGQAVLNPIGYYRTQIRTDYYLPLGQDFIWYFSFRAGYEQTLNSSDPTSPQYFIPLIKEFALGGIGSIRGYQEQFLNNPYPLIGGSLSYVNYRTQVDMPFSGPLRFGVFIDAGNLLVNNFSFGGLDYGTGFGFHYLTPVGPINFDLGFAIDPPPGADAYQIHFSVGII